MTIHILMHKSTLKTCKNKAMFSQVTARRSNPQPPKSMRICGILHAVLPVTTKMIKELHRFLVEKYFNLPELKSLTSKRQFLFHCLSFTSKLCDICTVRVFIFAILSILKPLLLYVWFSKVSSYDCSYSTTSKYYHFEHRSLDTTTPFFTSEVYQQENT